jgi:hypothetical protein
MSSKRALFLTTWTPNNEVFWKSLQCIGWDVEPHRYDIPERHSEVPEYVKQASPDIVVYVGAVGTHAQGVLPSPILKSLRDTAPTILLCGDAADAGWWPLMTEYRSMECFDVNVSIDGSAHPGFIDKLTPIDVRPYKPRSWGQRDIFIGANRGIGDGGERGHIVRHLNATMPVDIGSAPTPGTATSDDMASFLCRCKVVPNGPRTGSSNADHVKGRVVETGFGGACLLERANPATSRWFVPGVDYVSYNGDADAISQVQWIKDHDDEAMRIAERLNEKVIRDHHPKVFWTDILGKIGIEA